MALRDNRGFHATVGEHPPQLIIDTCMQIWPDDADFSVAHKHSVAAYAVTAFDPLADIRSAMSSMMEWHAIAREHDHLHVALTARDIETNYQNGHASLILASQGGDFIEDRIHRLEAFYRLGLRMVMLTYNHSNNLACGCLDTRNDGLTALGRVLVNEANRLGMLLDVTHLGERSSLDIIEQSEHPVVFSHSSVRALVDNPRNITDEQIDAAIAKGGLISIASWGPLLFQGEWPTTHNLADHIDYVAQRAGSTKNISIGTDMSLGSYPYHQRSRWPNAFTMDSVTAEYNSVVSGDVRSPKRGLADFNDYTEYQNAMNTLAERGYSNDDIAGIVGGNFLRVAREVWGS